MKEKIGISVAIILYLLLVVVTWDDSLKTSPDGRTILAFWHTYNDEEEGILRDIIKNWEALPENSKYMIRPVRIPFEGHKEKIRTALTVGHGPDMARVDWSFVCELAQKNAVVNLDSLGFRELAKDYLQAPLKSCLVGGSYYGLPDQSNCVALFYNRGMFKEAGLMSASASHKDELRALPKSWDELITVGEKLTDKSKDQYAFAMSNTLWWNLPFLNTFGARVISEDGKSCELNSPASIAAVELMASLYNKGVEAGAWRSGAITPEQGFVNNKYAMIFTGPWNLARFDSLKELDYGVALIPAGPNGSSSNIGGTDVVIFKDNEKEDTDRVKFAYSFLTYFTNAQNQLTWCKQLNQIPINMGTYDLLTFEDKNLNVFMEQMKLTQPNPVVRDFGMMEDIVNPEIEAVLTGQKTATEALNSAAKKIQERVLD
jgi:multiple sugar transport system substrate-binding protein